MWEWCYDRDSSVSTGEETAPLGSSSDSNRVKDAKLTEFCKQNSRGGCAVVPGTTMLPNNANAFAGLVLVAHRSPLANAQARFFILCYIDFLLI